MATAVFKQWVVGQKRSAISDLERKPRDKRNPKDEISVGQIISQQESSPIIHGPREYQLELFERATTENTIAVLDTGTGKTLIAVLLVRHIIDLELEHRHNVKPPRITFFLVPSVNLVFQQHAVLEANLDHPIARVYGSTGADLWTREQWLQLFTANKVIVCTPALLHLCLSHGFIRIEQLNLLIFDEAHHAKQNHPYSVIMKDYYLPLLHKDKAACPRIFGMTASPVDIKTHGDDVLHAARDLEETLHSRIATTKHLAPLQTLIHRPREVVVRYDRPLKTRSPLTQELLESYGSLGFLQDVAVRSDKISAHLGSWAGDAFWTIGLTDRLSQKSDTYLEGIAKQTGRPAKKTPESELAKLKELLQLVITSAAASPLPSPATISDKVACLRRCLEDFFSRPNDNTCLVFVDERNTAKLLSQLFSKYGPANLRPGCLLGISNHDFLTAGTTFRQQVLTLQKFRTGGLNCIFATSVADEGLDIPACNLIVRFDPCKTMIQYVQSRGRARHQNSHFYHMIETGNVDHNTLMERNHACEQLMKGFCAGLGADRHLIGTEDLYNVVEAEMDTFTEEETGAKLTTSNAMVILSRFVSSLPNPDDEVLAPLFIVKNTPGGFISELVLPACSPVPGCQGRVKRRNLWAKFSAAFLTCRALRKNGLLDQNMLPVYTVRRRLLQKAALALDGQTDSSQYIMRVKPDWNQHETSDQLYGLKITFSHGLQRPCLPIVLLSRKKLSEFPQFPLFPTTGHKTRVTTEVIPHLFKVDKDEELLKSLTTCTLRILQDLFNKTFENSPSKMPYWIAPLLADSDNLDLSMMASICKSQEGDVRWQPSMQSSELIDRYLVDPYDGGKRYFVKRVATELKASDTSPANNGKTASSILSETISLWKKSRAKSTWNPDQPVLEVDVVSPRRDWLAEPGGDEVQHSKIAYVCPEPLRISRIPPDFVTSCYALPFVLHRIEAYMIAKEAACALGLDIDFSLALEAVTKDSSAGDIAYEDEQNVIHHEGMGRNYERLKFLGDTFLKMATSIAVYVKNPHDSEYEYHTKRMLQLCNQNLYNVAVQKKLFEYIRSEGFSRRTWYPGGIKLLAGRGYKQATDETLVKRPLGRKTVADVAEALIGAALLSHDVGEWSPKNFDHAVKAVTTLVDSDQHDMTGWAGYNAAYILPSWQTKQARASEVDLADRVLKKHPYQFRNAKLLHSAFTHPSMPQIYETVRNYQQLEFLGDSLVDMVCVAYLYRKFPDVDESWLTEHKMAMVSNKFLSTLCVKLGFHRHLRHSQAALGSQISAYALELEEAERVSDARDYWTTVKEAPKALADVLEAYVGALFLDSDFDYSQVQRFFDLHMLPFFQDMAIYDSYTTNHPVTKLHKQLESFGCSKYRLMTEQMPTGDSSEGDAITGLVIHEQVIGGDKSDSSRYGKIRCAQKASRIIEGMPLSQFKATFGCDCEEGGETNKKTRRRMDDDCFVTGDEDEAEEDAF